MVAKQKENTDNRGACYADAYRTTLPGTSVYRSSCPQLIQLDVDHPPPPPPFIIVTM
jgi:hypothetical protein